MGTEYELSNPYDAASFGRLRELYDGVLGRLTEPPPTRVTPGTLQTTAYAALAAAWGVDEEWENIPGGDVYRRDADGGLWLVDAPPTDEEVMLPIVEAAMFAIGMRVHPRPVIPTIMRGLRRHG